MTKTPPTFEITDSHKAQEFMLLANGRKTGIRANAAHVYDLKEVGELTRTLMHYLGISYDRRGYVDDEGKTKLEDFTDEERRLYYPFAFMLACLDGNAFRSGHLNGVLEGGANMDPTPETISQYIPDAYRIIKANSGDLDEVRAMIMGAAKI